MKNKARRAFWCLVIVLALGYPFTEYSHSLEVAHTCKLHGFSGSFYPAIGEGYCFNKIKLSEISEGG